MPVLIALTELLVGGDAVGEVRLAEVAGEIVTGQFESDDIEEN